MTSTIRSPAFSATLEAFAARLAADLRRATTAEDIPALVEPAFIEMWPALATMPIGEAGRALAIAEVAAVANYCAAVRLAVVAGLPSALDALTTGPTSAGPK